MARERVLEGGGELSLYMYIPRTIEAVEDEKTKYLRDGSNDDEPACNCYQERREVRNPSLRRSAGAIQAVDWHDQGMCVSVTYYTALRTANELRRQDLPACLGCRCMGMYNEIPTSLTCETRPQESECTYYPSRTVLAHKLVWGLGGWDDRGEITRDVPRATDGRSSKRPNNTASMDVEACR